MEKRPLDERRLQEDARQSDVARGLQIDMVKRRRQVIGAIARTKLAKSFRVGDGKFLVGAKSLDRIANFLRLRHSQRRRADPGNHADYAIVARSAIDGVDHVAQRLFLVNISCADGVSGTSSRNASSKLASRIVLDGTFPLTPITTPSR